MTAPPVPQGRGRRRFRAGPLASGSLWVNAVDRSLMPAPYHHCSRCGAGDLETRGPREFVCRACGYKHFLTPIPAAGALVFDAQGRLLVIRRAHEPGLGKLGLPGGVIEPGETGEQAAARETFEEVGLRLPPERFRSWLTLPNTYLYQEYLWPTFDLFYAVRLDDPVKLQPDPAEVSEVLWLPLDDVPLDQFAFTSNAEAVRRWAAAG